MSDEVRLQALLAATARKDEQAFAKLYSLVSANLFAVAIRIVKSDSTAQDALQDAFVQIWHRAIDYHQLKGSPMAWMASIVRYRALDILRKQKPTVDVEAIDLELVNNELDPLGKVLESDRAQLLWDCLQELAAPQRRTILLAFYDGLTHDELADRTSTPLGTVKSWIRRGLQSIKRCLER